MKHITAFGDSIMRGVILDKSQEKPRYTLLDDNFSSRCGSTLGLEIHNHGRYGNTTAHGLRELDRRREQIAASDFCVLEFGGNDCDHRWAEIARQPEGEHRPITPLGCFAAQYHELVAGIRRLGSTPVMLSLPPIISDRYFENFTRTMSLDERSNVLGWLNGCIENITRWHEMYNLELFKLSNLLRVPIIDITTPFLSKRNFRDLFCDDGIHPNAAGHHLIAETICDYAKNYI